MDDHQRRKQPQQGLSGLSLPRRGNNAAPRTATPRSSSPDASKPTADRSRLAHRLADIDRSLSIESDAADESAARARALQTPQTPASEHPNVIAARAAIAKMAADEAAGVTTDDCVACTMLDDMDGPGTCKPADVASATPKQAPSSRSAVLQSAVPKPRTAKVSAANRRPAPSPANSPTRAVKKQPRRARAFGIGFAGGAVIAVGIGMFGTTILLDTHNVTAAPHHAIPASIGFEFSLASTANVYDGGPAWAWREAVTMRTIRDISIQRADTGTSWAARTQLSSLSRAGSVYPVAPSVRPSADAGSKTPHHTASIEVLAKLETASIPPVRKEPLRIAVATIEPAPIARLAASHPIETGHLLPLPDVKPDIRRASAPLAAPHLLVPAQDITRAVKQATTPPPPSSTKKNAAPAPKVTHHLAPRPERSATTEPANATISASAVNPRVHTGHHVLTKASTTPDRPLKLIATGKQRPSKDDDDDEDRANTASVSQPSVKPSTQRSSENHGIAKKAMLLRAAKESAPVAKPVAVVDAPKAKWYKAPMPSWAPFRIPDVN